MNSIFRLRSPICQSAHGEEEEAGGAGRHWVENGVPEGDGGPALLPGRSAGRWGLRRSRDKGLIQPGKAWDSQ